MTGSQTPPSQSFFVSRAGGDSAVAVAIAEILRQAGHEVTIQDRDFANSSFMSEMHDALTSGARVIALLSPAYLASDFCSAEWQSALARDPLNRAHRLIVFRVAECEPIGLLAPLWYWDLVPALSDRYPIGEIILHAVQEDQSQDATPVAGPYWRAARTIVRPDALAPTLSFTSREGELQAIGEQLWTQRNPVALHGLPGVGKTSLAREYARRNVERYAVIWSLSGETETDIIEQLAALGARINPALRDTKDIVAAAEHVTSALLRSFAKPVLLIFDNLEDELLLRRWLPEGAHAIVTSRSGSWSGDVVRLQIRPLSLEEAAEYLFRNSGRDLVANDAASVANALGSLPLALSHAAAYLRSTTTVTVQEYLRRLDVHLERLPPGTQFDRAVYATFAEAIALADTRRPGAAALMCLISCLDLQGIPKSVLSTRQPEYTSALSPHVGAEFVSSLGAVLDDDLRFAEALGELDRLSLIDYDPNSEALDVHRLVQAAARQLLAGDKLDWWAVAAVIAMNVSFPAPELGNWSVCERLLPHALSALSVLPKSLPLDAAGRLCNQVALYLDDRALYEAAEPLYRRSVDIALATQNSIGKPAIALSNLGWFLSRRGKYDEAEQMLRQAIDFAESKEGPGSHHLRPIIGNLAVILRETGRLEEAAAVQSRLDGLPTSGSAPTLGDTVLMNNRSRLLIEMGKLDEAEQLLTEALAIERSRHGNRHPAVALTLENIAELAEARGQDEEGISAFREALNILEETYGPSHPDVGRCLARMGTLVAAKHPAEAESLYYRALAIFEPFGDMHIQTSTRVYNNLAALLVSSGRRTDAENVFRRALQSLTAAGLGQSEDAALLLANGGANSIGNGRLLDAEAFLRQALAVFGSLVPVRRDVVAVLRMLASVLRALSQTVEANDLLERAARIERHFW